MSKEHKATNTLRNVPAFIKSYLGSDAGISALKRKPIRVKDGATGKFTEVWRSPAMADAFQRGVGK